MTEGRELHLSPEALYRLSAWLSPSFPIGAFSYSHGLERAVETGRVSDAETLLSWSEDLLRHGAGRADAILLAAAHGAVRAGDGEALAALDAEALALAASSERLLETRAQGRAFSETVRTAWTETKIDEMPEALPVAVGCACARAGIPLEPTLLCYLHAFAANLVSAGVRLVPLGQSDGQRVTAALMPLVRELVEAALTAPTEDLGGFAILGEIASMQHETQYTRLFRS